MIQSIEPTPLDCTLTPYDYSTLTAVHTCPTFGIIRYGMHKTFEGSHRAMALEAGHAMHDVFAADRLWQLAHIDRLPDHADYRGKTLFGNERWGQLRDSLFVSTPERPEHLTFGIAVLESSGFYDDPKDNRRTLSNLTNTSIAYMDRSLKEWPIYVHDSSDPTSFVGIECPFDFLVTFTDGFQIRFIGRVDGIHWHANKTEIWPHENKTGSRLNESWLHSFRTSHQITGYMLMAGAMVKQQLRWGMVHGAAIPLPKSFDFGGIVRETVERKAHHIASWETWAREGIGVFEKWKNNPFEAPKFTHSCNRYFRTCQYIDFCSSDRASQEELLDMMSISKWSPLEEKTSD
jgi:hypothetical protein